MLHHIIHDYIMILQVRIDPCQKDIIGYGMFDGVLN